MAEQDLEETNESIDLDSLELDFSDAESNDSKSGNDTSTDDLSDEDKEVYQILKEQYEESINVAS